MKSVSPVFVFSFLVLTVCASQALSQTEREATTAQIVAAIAGPAKSQTLVLHFEITLNGKPVGFSSTSLSATEGRRSDSYRYQSEAVIRLGDGTRIEGWTMASLKKSFEPTEIELRREVIAPNGQRKSSIDRAEILDKEVLLTRETDGGARTQRSVSRPQSPFVFAVELIVQRVDLKGFPAFAIREFDPQKGNITVHHFKAEPESGGVRRVVSRKDDGGVGYAFEIDAKGGLVSWSEPPLPVVSKRCSRERFEELRKLIQGW